MTDDTLKAIDALITQQRSIATQVNAQLEKWEAIRRDLTPGHESAPTARATERDYLAEFRALQLPGVPRRSKIRSFSDLEPGITTLGHAFDMAVGDSREQQAYLGFLQLYGLFVDYTQRLLLVTTRAPQYVKWANEHAPNVDTRFLQALARQTGHDNARTRYSAALGKTGYVRELDIAAPATDGSELL